MVIRYTDSAAKNDVTPDFAPRKRKPSLFELLMIFLLGIILSITLSVLILNKMALIVCLCLLLSAAGWYVILSIAQSRDLVLATEFQNALFASALGFSNKFCLIIKRDGSIIYTDRGFQRMFPTLVSERDISIVGMVKHGRISLSDKEKIYEAIDRGFYDTSVVEICDSSGTVNKLVLSVEPIVRPSGFLLIRAREYIEQRAGEEDNTLAQSQPHSPENLLLTKSSLTLFANVMARMNAGIYITDPDGVIIYANHLLEQWLAYRETEIMAANLKLPDILHQNNSESVAIAPENFEGEFVLKTKNNRLIKAFINQKVIYGDNQKSLGCIAIVNNRIEKKSTSPSW